ncbi:MAG: toll/interleukin-1 receptor domain-containing protein [Nevskiaceae bacterium]
MTAIRSIPPIRDETAVIRLAQALEADGAIDVSRDKDDILPAEDWNDRLAALILLADGFVLCLSPDAASSTEVGREIDAALREHKRIVPVVLRDTPEAVVRAEVRRLNYVFLRANDPFDAQVALLRAAVQTDIAWVREHTRLGELAQGWAGNHRRASDELRGPTLEAAERWVASRPAEAPTPTELQLQFIATSRRGATRRLRWWVAMGFGVALLASVLSLIALWQRIEATLQRTTAQARRLVAEAQAVLADPLQPASRPRKACWPHWRCGLATMRRGRPWRAP